MAYGTRYVLPFASANGNRMEARILQQDYTGAATRAVPTESGIETEWGRKGAWIFTPLLGSETTCNIWRQHGGDTVLQEVKGSEWDTFRLEVYDVDAAVRRWYGRILTDEFAESTMQDSSEMELNAVDGIGDLENVGYHDTDPATGDPVPYTGRARIITIIARCLQKTGLGLPLAAATNWTTPSLTDPTVEPLSEFYVDQNVLWDAAEGQAVDCYSVLRMCCLAFGAQLFQRNGRWFVVQRELMNQQYTATLFDSTGTPEGSTVTIGPPTDTFEKVKRTGEGTFRSAFGKVPVLYDHGPVPSFLDATDMRKSYYYNNANERSRTDRSRRTRVDREGGTFEDPPEPPDFVSATDAWDLYDPDLGVGETDNVLFKSTDEDPNMRRRNGRSYRPRGGTIGRGTTPRGGGGGSENARTIERRNVLHIEGRELGSKDLLTRRDILADDGNRRARQYGKIVNPGDVLGIYLENYIGFRDGKSKGLFQAYVKIWLLDQDSGTTADAYELRPDGSWVTIDVASFDPNADIQAMFWRLPGIDAKYKKSGVPLKEWTSKEIITAPVPARSQVVCHLYGSADHSNGPRTVAATLWDTADIWLADESGQRRDVTRYVVETDNQEPVKDVVTTYFGQGPVDHQPEGFTVTTGQFVAKDWKSGFYSGGETPTGKEHGELLAEQILRHQATPLQERHEEYEGVGNPIGSGIQVGADGYIPVWLNYNWHHDTSDGEWIQHKYYTGTVRSATWAEDESFYSPGSSLPTSEGGGGTQDSQDAGESIELLASTNPLTKLTADIGENTAISSLPVEPADQGALNAGDVIAVVDTETGSTGFFRVTADETLGDNTLSVEDPATPGAAQTLPFYLSVGSGVYLASRYVKKLFNDLRADVDQNAADILQLQTDRDRLVASEFEPEEALFLTAGTHSGLVSTLSVVSEDPQTAVLKAGDVIRVTPPNLGQSVYMRVQTDQPDGTTALPVEDPAATGNAVDLPFELPPGSIVRWKHRDMAANVRTATDAVADTPEHRGGTAVIESGTNSITVTPNLATDLRNAVIQVTPRTDMGTPTNFWVSNIGETSFDIELDGPASADIRVEWLVVAELKDAVPGAPTNLLATADQAADTVTFTWDAPA